MSEGQQEPVRLSDLVTAYAERREADLEVFSWISQDDRTAIVGQARALEVKRSASLAIDRRQAANTKVEDLLERAYREALRRDKEEG